MPYAKRPRGKRGRKSHLELLERISRAKGPGELLWAVTFHEPVLSVEEGVRMIQEKPATVISLARGLDDEGRVLLVESGEGIIMNGDVAEKKLDDVLSLLKGLHEEEPDNPGSPVDTLCRKFLPEMEVRHAKRVIERWVQGGRLEIEEQRVRLPGFLPGDAARRGAAGAEILDICSERMFQLPEISDITEKTGLSKNEAEKAMETLRSQGQVFIAGSGFVVSKDVLESFIGNLRSIEGDITVASVRDATGSSRKYVLPLLEMLDSMGVTRRVQEKRIMRKK